MPENWISGTRVPPLDSLINFFQQNFIINKNNCFFLFVSELTPWTPWTECSKTCGSGERTRERNCEIPSQNSKSNNNPCGNAPLFEREICNPQKCPVYTEWSEWTQCSKTCGGGKQSRERACVLPPISSLYTKGKLICDGPSKQSR